MEYQTTTALLSMTYPNDKSMTVAEALIHGGNLDDLATWLNEFVLSRLRTEQGDNIYPITDKKVMEDVISTVLPYLSDQRLFDLNESLCRSEVRYRSQQEFRTSTFARFFMYAEMRREKKASANGNPPERFLYHYQNSIRPMVAKHFHEKRKNEINFLQFNFLKTVNLSSVNAILDAKAVSFPTLASNAKSTKDLQLELQRFKPTSKDSKRKADSPKETRRARLKFGIDLNFFKADTPKISSPMSMHKTSNTNDQEHDLIIMEQELTDKMQVLTEVYKSIHRKIEELESRLDQESASKSVKWDPPAIKEQLELYIIKRGDVETDIAVTNELLSQIQNKLNDVSNSNDPPPPKPTPKHR